MKKVSLIFAASLVVVSMLSGCATGNTSIAQESTDSVQQKLIKGKTTKAQVKATFGEPSDQGINEGLEYWGYQMARADAKSFIPFIGLVTGENHISGKYLRISFNKNGTVESYGLTATKI